MTNETNYIEQLRKYDEFEGTGGYYGRSKEVGEIEDLLYIAKAKEVHSEFEDGGRWSNYETTVWKVESNGKEAYFSVCREVPATEMQDGGEFSYSFCEVVPKEVTVIKYVGGTSE